MAICKHVPCKNGFGAAVEYLTTQHDSKGRLILDVEGTPRPREGCLLDGINCLPETFAAQCLEDRLHFGKTFDPKTVDTHQYIISFAPSDSEKGLTVQKAHKFGCRLAANNFPGHRILVCTHPDGARHAGNIHVHIVISSLRFEDRPIDLGFMGQRRDGGIKPSEYRAGCAHQDTGALRRHLIRQVNDYCRYHGYEVCPEKAGTKIRPEEFFIQSRGLESRNDQLRRAISDAATTTGSWDAFCKKLETAYTHQVPVVPPVPFAVRKKFWEEYKELNRGFWTWDKALRNSFRQELNAAFQELKSCKNKERKKALRSKISFLKDQQAKERLFRKTYQTYLQAASLAMRNRDLEDAWICLEQIRELSRRREGYWQEGWQRDSGSFSLLDGTVKSHITWKQISEEDLAAAENALEEIQETVRLYRFAASEFMEEPMPIGAKVSRGTVSFKHPDSEHWIRGKRLGANYTLEALGISPPKGHSKTHGRIVQMQR